MTPRNSLDVGVLDKSDTHTLTKLYLCSQMLTLQTELQFTRLYQNFLKDRWFALRLRNEGLVNFLEYSIENQEAAALEALVLAFCFPTTRQSLLELCSGIFGESASVNLIEGAGTLTLEVTNANASFVWGWQNLHWPASAIEDSQGRWIVFRVFSVLGDNNLKSFFLQFAPVGVVCQVKLLDSSQTQNLYQKI